MRQRWFSPFLGGEGDTKQGLGAPSSSTCRGPAGFDPDSRVITVRLSDRERQENVQPGLRATVGRDGRTL